jgi:predicted nucleotidyltransferase
MGIDQVVQECKTRLKSHYGARFRGLVVYGSVARKQSTPGSDIDLLVLLTGPFNYFDEVRQIIDLLYPIQLESDQLVSAKPVSLDDYERGRIQLYRTAKREGVLV